MMRQAFLIFIIAFIGISQTIAKENAQTSTDKNKSINFGIRAGFNSSMFMVSKLQINDHTIDEIQNNYKNGYLLAFFTRFNIKNHFIQPELSYNINKSEIAFDKQENSDLKEEVTYSSIKSTIHSFDLPILYGYNFVKSFPYSMAIFGGPKFRYLWKNKCDTEFQNFDQQNIREKLHPINVGIVIGIGVTISQLFFDFRYEQGITNLSKSVTYTSDPSQTTSNNSNITVCRKESTLSFSFGLLF